MMFKPKIITPEQVEEIRTKNFFDCIAPATIKFYSDYYIVGDTYRCCWVIKEYPPSTEELAILSLLSDKSGVTLRIFNRLVDPIEQRKIVQNAMRKNTMKSASNDVNDTVQAVIPLKHLSYWPSYMSNKLLGEGFAAASIDELYLFLTNRTAIEYIRNLMKRVRKKDSTMILASQNIEDFLIPGIKEMTKPLFSIPTHQFLFNPGQINPKDFMDALQIEPSEYDLIKYPERGSCLYRCGNERYLLQVNAPSYKAELFGTAGGR